ncbi:membrane protein [Caballeronia arvi]|uniref:Membrane protein n=1 Tax=Caballeronia arvi TaxID=1777135 RepID=A0A158KT65_9BURK|nr:membrane protein [Caballeronia arvi]
MRSDGAGCPGVDSVRLLHHRKANDVFCSAMDAVNWRKAVDNANGSASPIHKMPSDEPPLARRTVASAMDAALSPGMGQAQSASVTPLAPGAAHKPPKYAPYHVHGSVLEGGDSPTVLAQPSSAMAEGQGSQFHPARPVPRRMRVVLTGAQDVVAGRYRQAKEGTEDFVHENPWKSIALAAVGGVIVGLLASR